MANFCCVFKKPSNHRNRSCIKAGNIEQKHRPHKTTGFCSIRLFTNISRRMSKQKNKKGFLRRHSSYFDKGAPTIALKSLFTKYDTDSDGMLNKDELYHLLQGDLGLDEEQCDIYHHLLDKNADSLISYKEFETWLHSGERFKSIADKTRYYYLKKAIVMFKKYDTDNNLAIDEHEFHELYKDLGGSGKEDEHAALEKIDLDHNGRVSFPEFLKWLHWVPLDHLIEGLD